RVQCRFIFWKLSDEQEARERYEYLRSDDLAFGEAARMQPWGVLGAGGGRVKPFGRHTLIDQVVEDAAFALRPGQVSELIKLGDGIVLIKCDQRLPADTTVSFESKRAELTRDVLERKVEVEIPKYVANLILEANPQNYIVGNPAQQIPPRTDM